VEHYDLRTSDIARLLRRLVSCIEQCVCRRRPVRTRPGIEEVGTWRAAQPARRGSVACTADRGGPSWPSREAVAGNATAKIEGLPAPAAQKSSRVARTSILIRIRGTIWLALKEHRTYVCHPKPRRLRAAAPGRMGAAQRYRSHPNPNPSRNRHPRFPCLSRRQNHRRRIRSRPLRRAVTSGIAGDARALTTSPGVKPYVGELSSSFRGQPCRRPVFLASRVVPHVGVAKRRQARAPRLRTHDTSARLNT
jgi:hypothetical protein